MVDIQIKNPSLYPKEDHMGNDSLVLPQRDVSVEAELFTDIIELFFEDAAERVSARTVYCYRSELTPFTTWWEEHPDRHEYKLSKAMFDDFIEWMATDYLNRHGRKPTGYVQARTTQRIRNILDWMHDQGCVQQKITDLCRQLEPEETLKYYPSVEELQAMFDAKPDEESFFHHDHMRIKALLAFTLATGARRTEVAHARVEDLRFDTPLTNVNLNSAHTGYVDLHVVKGGSDIGRVSVFCSKAGLLLKLYLRSFCRTSGSIFMWGDDATYVRIKKLGEYIGATEMHAHSCRDAFIDYWGDANMDGGFMADLALALQVGHSVKSISKNARGHYIDIRNRRKVLTRIRQYYVSPLDQLEIDWEQYPVDLSDVSG